MVVPDQPGVYAIYNPQGELQYMGLSRRLASSIDLHREDLPDEAAGVRFQVIKGGAKEQLQAAWKEWMTEVRVGGWFPVREREWEREREKKRIFSLSIFAAQGSAEENK